MIARLSNHQTVFDVVVVGSGAGGAAVLRPLLAQGLKVCVLERGEDVQPAAQPTEGDIGRGFAPFQTLPNVLLDPASGKPYAPFLTEGSALGGSTIMYTGNVLRFHPSDFHRHRTLGDVAGAHLADWPFAYEALAPYYEAIEEEMGVAGEATANPFEPPRRGPYPQPAVRFDRAGELCASAARQLGWNPFPIPTVANPAQGRRACVQCGLCTGYLCTASARWSARDPVVAAVSQGVALRLGATVTRILTDEAGDRVRAVEYLDRDGATHAVTARAIVLAANAIQTPRLLLQSSTNRHPQGLANDSGQVGRNLMTHTVESFVTLGHIPGERTVPSAGCTLAIQDFYDSARSGVALPFTLEPRAIGAVSAFAKVVQLDSAWRAAVEDPQTLAERHRGHITVMAMGEDLPQEKNRITLSPTLRDPHGLPVAVVEYTPHALDLETSAAASARAKELLDRVGAQDVVSLPARSGRFHAMGTCRMGRDPSHAVVDGEGRAHTLRNLYIADSSLFVTSAGVNPSITVQALARRVGDAIVARMSARDL